MPRALTHISKVFGRGQSRWNLVCSRQCKWPKQPEVDDGKHFVGCDTCPAFAHSACMGLSKKAARENNFTCLRCENRQNSVSGSKRRRNADIDLEQRPRKKMRLNVDRLLLAPRENRIGWPTDTINRLATVPAELLIHMLQFVGMRDLFVACRVNKRFQATITSNRKICFVMPTLEVRSSMSQDPSTIEWSRNVRQSSAYNHLIVTTSYNQSASFVNTVDYLDRFFEKCRSLNVKMWSLSSHKTLSEIGQNWTRFQIGMKSFLINATSIDVENFYSMLWLNKLGFEAPEVTHISGIHLRTLCTFKAKVFPKLRSIEFAMWDFDYKTFASVENELWEKEWCEKVESITVWLSIFNKEELAKSTESLIQLTKQFEKVQTLKIRINYLDPFETNDEMSEPTPNERLRGALGSINVEICYGSPWKMGNEMAERLTKYLKRIGILGMNAVVKR